MSWMPPQPSMVVGFNYPWTQYGHDFGPPLTYMSGRRTTAADENRWDAKLPKQQQLPSKTGKNRTLLTKLDQSLDAYRDAGIRIIRYFLLCDGWNFGTPRFSSDKWSFCVPAKVDPSFFTDFKRLLQSFADADMQILPVLVNFPIFAPGSIYLGKDLLGKDVDVTVSGKYSSVDAFAIQYFQKSKDIIRNDDLAVNWNECVRGGKQQLLTPDTRTKFFKNFVTPLVSVARDFPKRVFAWEICSEPDLGAKRYGLNPPDVADFLFLGLQHILSIDSNTPVTIGFQSRAGIDVLFPLNGSQRKTLDQLEYPMRRLFWQWHFYPEKDTQTVSALAAPKSPLGRSTAILGEFRTEFSHEKPMADWPRDVGARLQAISSANFGYAFPWSGLAIKEDGDHCSDWNQAASDSARKFIASQQ